VLRKGRRSNLSPPFPFLRRNPFKGVREGNGRRRGVPTEGSCLSPLLPFPYLKGKEEEGEEEKKEDRKKQREICVLTGQYRKVGYEE